MKDVRCPFCNHDVLLPTGSNVLEQVLTCSGCNVAYWLTSSDDLNEVLHDAADHFGIPERQARDEIESKVIREVDRMLEYRRQDATEGIELCLVFVRRE